MRSLESLFDFAPCPEGEITLCEVDGRLHSMKLEYANITAFTNAVSWVTLYIHNQLQLFISYLQFI